MNTTFLRLLAYDDKPNALAAAIDALRAGEECPDAFSTDPASFRRIPGSPLAYAVPKTVLDAFREHKQFEHATRSARCGMGTLDDFRFLRTHWEICPDEFVFGKWLIFAKGGGASSYYADIALLVNYENNGTELKDFVTSKVGSASRKIQAESYYFRRGITFGRRIRRFSPNILPQGSIFSDSSNSVFFEHDAEFTILSWLGLLNSSVVKYLLSLFVPLRKMEVGFVQRTPVPDLNNQQGVRLGELALDCVELKRNLDRVNETSHVFHLPVMLQVDGPTLASRAATWAVLLAESKARLEANQRQIDAIAFELYRIDRAELAISGAAPDAGGEQPDADEEGDENDEVEQVAPADLVSLSAALISYLVGCAYGRFDIRYATRALPTPTLANPFAPLLACSPGMLTGNDGLPLQVAPEGYPLLLDGDGILIDDPDHTNDIVGRLRAALELIFGSLAEAIEAEACAALGVAGLRDYLRRPGAGGFWADHIRRYSKSRRKAPIYWLLQSPKRSYAIWLYLHRLDGDTLSKALVNYVEPKLRFEEERLERLNAAKGGLTGRDLRQAEREVERQEATIADIHELRDRLERAVKRYLVPDLNDGVVLTIAPLHELVPWKEAKQYWDELLAGKYEWSSIGKQLREKGLTK